jgi:AsmA protein
MRRPTEPESARTTVRRFFERWPRFGRAGLWAAVCLALAAAGAALAPWTVSRTALLEAIASQLRTTTGIYVAATGRATFSLLPRPHVAVERITFADAGLALTIEADRLHGELDILPLLVGRLDVAKITLTHPRIMVDLDRKPMSGEGAAARAAKAQPTTPEARKADDARLAAVSIQGGSARVKSEGAETAIDNIDATLDWRKIGAPATLLGSFSWHGERPHALLWIARPGALLRGEQSVVTTRVDSDSVHLEAEGLGQTGPTPRYTGRLAISSPSLRQALNLLTISAPLPGPFENIQLTAQASLGARDLQLSNLRLFADDNEFEGSLALRREGERRIVQATLSSRFVSLKPMLADMPALTGADGQWSREVFDLPDLSGADVDLRLLVAHARLARLSIDDAELTATLRAGRLDIALAEARAYKGKVKASATFAARPDQGLDFHASAQTIGVDAGALLWDAAARQDLTGALESSLLLDAGGDSVAGLARDLDGRANLTLTQGEIVGVDLERALRRLDQRPLSSALAIRSGRSILDKASATIRIVKGAASIENASANGPGFALVFSGAIKIPDRTFTLAARANEADDAGKPRDKGQRIDFDLTGPWDEPNFSPDAQALIKRSGAAAPLLPREPPAPEGLER